jgi:predicted NBD/HSP70 family sugar kinase
MTEYRSQERSPGPADEAASRLLALLAEQRALLARDDADAAGALEQTAGQIEQALAALQSVLNPPTQGLGLRAGRPAQTPTTLDPAQARAIRQAIQENKQAIARLSESNRRALAALFGEGDTLYKR